MKRKQYVLLVVLTVVAGLIGGAVIAVEKEEEAMPTPKVDKIGKDGAPMVLIPAGEFQMGTDPSEIAALVQQYGAKAFWFESETPRHTVYVDAFYMDVYEVTNAQYQKFMEATGHSAPRYSSDSRYNAPEQPMVGVSWHDAVAYAEWAGKRLPTEAQWEKAARGGLSGKRYPWGDEAPDAGGVYRASYGNNTADGHRYAAPAGSFAPNYGLYDMAGNVWEWCADWYDRSYYANSPLNNPLGPDSGTKRVLRGGSWYSSPYYLRVATRAIHLSGEHARHLIGFRCISQD